MDWLDDASSCLNQLLTFGSFSSEVLTLPSRRRWPGRRTAPSPSRTRPASRGPSRRPAAPGRGSARSWAPGERADRVRRRVALQRGLDPHRGRAAPAAPARTPPHAAGQTRKRDVGREPVRVTAQLELLLGRRDVAARLGQRVVEVEPVAPHGRRHSGGGDVAAVGAAVGGLQVGLIRRELDRHPAVYVVQRRHLGVDVVEPHEPVDRVVRARLQRRAEQIRPAPRPARRCPPGPSGCRRPAAGCRCRPRSRSGSRRSCWPAA